MLERLGQELLVVRELTVDPARRQPNVASAEHDVVLLDADLQLAGVLRDPRELRERARGHDRLELRGGLSRELRFLHGHPVRVRGGHDQLPALEADENTGQHGTRLVPRGGARNTRHRLEERGAVDGECLRALDFGQLGKVLGAVGVQLVARRPASDLQHPVLRLVLEDDLALRQQPRQVDEQASRSNDGSVTLDLRLDGEPQRQFHVGCRQVQLPSPARNSTPPST